MHKVSCLTQGSVIVRRAPARDGGDARDVFFNATLDVQPRCFLSQNGLRTSQGSEGRKARCATEVLFIAERPPVYAERQRPMSRHAQSIHVGLYSWATSLLLQSAAPTSRSRPKGISSLISQIAHPFSRFRINHHPR